VNVPRFEEDGPFIRAICEPEGYCKDGHRCGRLDIGIRRAAGLNTTNDFEVFCEQWRELDDEELALWDLLRNLP
jgi:hypothetical protein